MAAAESRTLPGGLRLRAGTLEEPSEEPKPALPAAFPAFELVTGRLYQQFALTIAVSVLISAFNALTLSPALSALLLRPRKEASGFFGRLGTGCWREGGP